MKNKLMVDGNKVTGPVYALAVVLSIILQILPIPLCGLVYGYALGNLWRWFMVPAGYAMPQFKVFYAISLMVVMLTHQRRPVSEDKYNDLFEEIFGLLMRAVVFMFFGFWTAQVWQAIGGAF